jgi:hypothetical protein
MMNLGGLGSATASQRYGSAFPHSALGRAAHFTAPDAAEGVGHQSTSGTGNDGAEPGRAGTGIQETKVNDLLSTEGQVTVGIYQQKFTVYRTGYRRYIGIGILLPGKRILIRHTCKL